MKILAFWVEGRPVAWQRAVTVRTPRGKRRTFVPDRTRRWKSTVRLHAMRAVACAGWTPDDAAYSVDVAVYRARRAGDADNYLKAIKDALNAIVWPDDRMVIESCVRLIDGQGTGVMVRVSKEPRP